MQKKKPVAILIVVLLIVLVLAFFLLTSKKLNVLGKYCTVEFSGTNEKIDSKTVKCGNKIEEVGDPEREGFIFLGWYDGDEEFDFDEEVNEDMVLTAKWESEDDPNVVPVTGIYVESNSIKIKVKQSMVVVAKVKPDDATNTKLIWSSSDEKVVTVDKKGTIEGKSAGTAIITVKTEDGNFKEEIKVEVEKVATSVSLQNDEITLSVGQS